MPNRNEQPRRQPSANQGTSPTTFMDRLRGVGIRGVRARPAGRPAVRRPASERIEAAPAARLVEARGADQHAVAAGDQPLRVVGRVAADHADGVGLGDVLGDRQQLRHRLERLAQVVLVEAGDDHPLAAVGQRVADRRQVLVEELPFVDADDLGVGARRCSSSSRELAHRATTRCASRCARRCGRRRSGCRSIGLKIWTCWRAIWARRSRRISSSLLPLNMLPTMTSIQPWLGCRTTSMARLDRRTRSRGVEDHRLPDASGARLILAGVGADADHVAGVDERRHLDDQAGLERRRLDLRAGGRALDAGRGVGDLQIDGRRQLDADRLDRRRTRPGSSSRLQVVHRSPSASLEMWICSYDVGVHEVVVVAVLVEVLHLALVERRRARPCLPTAASGRDSAPLRMLRSLTRTKPRRLPGVTCCSSRTRNRSCSILISMPFFRRVACMEAIMSSGRTCGS